MERSLNRPVVMSDADNLILDSSSSSSKLVKLDDSPISPSSFVIVTFLRKDLVPDHLENFVESIILQKNVTFDLIFLDEYSACDEKRVLRRSALGRLLNRDKKLVQKLNYRIISKEKCDSTDASDSLAVMNLLQDAINEKTRWVLSLKPSLNFDWDENFLFQLIDFPIRQRGYRETLLARNKYIHMNLAGIGCKTVSHNGNTLIQAGGILWNDGTLERFGNGTEYHNDDAFIYRRPTDFVSTDCLLLDKDLYMDFVPRENIFSMEEYDNRLIEGQLMAQHKLKRFIWYEARAVARDFDKLDKPSKSLSDRARNDLKSFLEVDHLPPANSAEDYAHISRASDLRARASFNANLYYVDQEFPDKSRGGGFGRSFDNLAMLSELGHYVTLTSINRLRCSDECFDALYELNIPLTAHKTYHQYLGYRVELFDIVMVSRPSTMRAAYPWIRYRYKKHAFALIYDCEALWFRRDQLARSLKKNKGIQFPGNRFDFSDNLQDLAERAISEAELSMLHMPDIILAVSDSEKDYVHDYLSSESDTSLREKPLFTIGHIFDSSRNNFDSLPNFEERSGLLFVAAFHDDMYYNGDAIWYFLKEVYPLVLRESSDISLTIVGRGIPEELRNFVENHDELKFHPIFFVEAPESLDKFYNTAKLFIAPHLYGAGIQYKVSFIFGHQQIENISNFNYCWLLQVSESFSRGVPVILSEFSASGFGFRSVDNRKQDSAVCVGDSAEGMKDCIIELYKDERKWTSHQQNAIEFLKRTHDRNFISKQLSSIIDMGMTIARENRLGEDLPYRRKHNMFTYKYPLPGGYCPEGETIYLGSYKDVKWSIENEDKFSTAYEHWQYAGKKENRLYLCFDIYSNNKK